MNLTTKLQPIFILSAAALGLLLGYLTQFGVFSVQLIEPFLMILLYFVFLSVDGTKFKRSFLNLKFTATAVLVNFVWTPIFTYLLGLLFFRGVIDLQMGLMMLMVTPCTDWYIVFTGLSKGNVELGASLLPLNLLLQILLLPVYLLLFFGGTVHFQINAILASIITVLLIPFLLSFFTKYLETHFSSWTSLGQRLRSRGDDAQLLFLCLAVISMFASESRELFNHPLLLLKMLLPLLLFFTVNFIFVQAIGRRLRFPTADTVALNFTTLARNSPLSLAIAVAAFPDRPLISLALVIGPLIELPVLSVISSILLRRQD